MRIYWDITNNIIFWLVQKWCVYAKMTAWMGILMIRHRTLGVSYFQTKPFESPWNQIVVILVSFLCWMRRLNNCWSELRPSTHSLPSGSLTYSSYGKWPFYIVLHINSKWCFSIAMLNYQRVLLLIWKSYRSKFEGIQLCPYLDGLWPAHSLGRLLWKDVPWFFGHAEVQRRLDQLHVFSTGNGGQCGISCMETCWGCPPETYLVRNWVS